MNFISIIVPVYNTKVDTLESCISSLLSQTNQTDYEIIIINDGSSDKHTNLFLNKLKNNKINVINSKNNNGTSKAREIGFKHSKGSHICFVDSDDTITKSYIEQILKLINHQNLDVIFLNVLAKNINKNNHKLLNSNEMFKKGKIYWAMCSMVINKNFILSNKIKFVNQNWSSKIEYSFLEDLYFFMQVVSNLQVTKCVLLSNKIYNYNKNNSSITNTNLSQVNLLYMRMRNIIDGYNKDKSELTKKDIKNIFFKRRIFCWSDRLIKKNTIICDLYQKYINLNIPKIWYKIYSIEFFYKLWFQIKKISTTRRSVLKKK